MEFPEQEKTSYLNQFEGKTIMITGGLGFIGSNLAHKLTQLNPEKIILIDSLLKNHGGNISNIKEIQNKVEIPDFDIGGVDIRNHPKITKLLNNVDYVFNLAGSTSHSRSSENPLRDLEINLESHVSFLNSCRTYIKNSKKPLKILFSSTRDIYGKIPEIELPAKESFPCITPADPQGIHNQAAEQHHLWMKNFGINSTVLRLTNTYGPRHQMKTPDGFINWFIKKSLENEEIELWGGGISLRDFNYIDDVIDAFLLTMSNPKTNQQTYNLGSFTRKINPCITPQIKSIKEIAETIIEIAESGSVKEIPYPEDKKQIEPGHFFADITKIHTQLGWMPKTELKAGILKTLNFYKQNKQNYW